MNKIDLKRLASYTADFALWSAEQAALIRAGKIDRVDLENVAEEIESLGRSDRYEIESRLSVLIMHLLKWQYQPDGRTNSWLATIRDQRYFIGRKVADSPSLKKFPSTVLSARYEIARPAASGETGLPLSAFPESCPYMIDQILDPDFLPSD